MPFEIDFLPVGSGQSSGDAIALRYHDGTQWRVMVIDAGYAETGEALCDHVRRNYGTDVIDFLVSTHPDNDHMSGLRVVLENMRVGRFWMSVPAFHAEQLLPLFQSRRWLVENLASELRRQYSYVTELVNLASSRGVVVAPPFQGERIGPFTVLTPSLQMYLGLLPQFRDTPPPDRDLLQTLGVWMQGIGRRISRGINYIVPENWQTETLREGGITSAENESSVVLYGDLGCGGILLTSDIGLKGMVEAVRFAAVSGINLSGSLWVFQVPHHGSRNNISPTVLNHLIGFPVSEGSKRNPHCIITAGAEDPTHPRQVVVNALIRRGVNAFVTRGTTITFWHEVEMRRGLVSLNPLQFSSRVEEYE
jgi:beta-lactamase superfamily II metal-dependent hydrolase